MDIYDKEVEYLTENPRQILSHWNSWSPLFGKASINRGEIGDGDSCGCLTQVAHTRAKAITEELTQAIRNDSRIPIDAEMLTREELIVFAEWQRRLDKEIPNRKPIQEIWKRNYAKPTI